MPSVGGKRASTGFASSDAQEDRERNRFQSETTAPTSFHPLDGGARTAVSSQDSRNALQASVHARRESCRFDLGRMGGRLSGEQIHHLVT